MHVIKAGAEDLLTKPVAKEKLVQAIERALARARAMREKHEQLDVLRTLVSHLSPRERQVFERVVRGKMNKEIARELGTTERTIKAHRHDVMEKVQASVLGRAGDDRRAAWCPCNQRLSDNCAPEWSRPRLNGRTSTDARAIGAARGLDQTRCFMTSTWVPVDTRS